MSLTITNTFVAGAKARAAEVNKNFTDVSGKFTEGTGGIADGDISSAAAIKSSKLSSVSGNRITQAQLEDDAVDLRVLKDDAASGSPNAAVNNANHIKDGIITNAKLVAGTLKKGSLNLASVLVAVPALAPGVTFNVSTTLNSSSAFPFAVVQENGAEYWVHAKVKLTTGTGAYDLVGSNSSGVSNSAIFNIRVWYLVV